MHAVVVRASIVVAVVATAASWQCRLKNQYGDALEMMTLIEEYFRRSKHGGANGGEEGFRQWEREGHFKRIIRAVGELFHGWNFRLTFEELFTDCAIAYLAGYTMVASGDPTSRQEYAIKAIRYADLAASRQGPWCDESVLTAFAKQWPLSDASVYEAFDWAACGATSFPRSWTGLLRFTCTDARLFRKALENQSAFQGVLERRNFFPRLPLPVSARLFCEHGYLALPPLEPNLTLEEFYQMLAPRLGMVSTPFYSSDVMQACAPSQNCSVQNHFLLVEALRHVEHKIGGLHLEFGVHQGHSANITARYLQSLSRFMCKRMALGDSPAVLRAWTPRVYAFDSFQGLPQDFLQRLSWHPQGSFDLGGLIPPMEENCQPVHGWFNKSIPAFVADVSRKEARTATQGRLYANFVFIDCDLYTSTADALLSLQHSGLLRDGTVLAFDELLDVHPLAVGEVAALHELLVLHPRPIDFLVGGWRRNTMANGGFGAIKLRGP
eukprot:TRINITY_DN26013_c0_g1_i1.p1 TRINITY_DN26013_c0_g1~~TRINITY_DN26013_c0_g1_i1.p1  ORF type:complete len:503 (+),score=62.18 TRINITY_DN26013_c0_g1_i1:27-1511(+)